jgi:hypothetical protein
LEKEVVQIEGKEVLDWGPEENNRIKQNDVKNINSKEPLSKNRVNGSRSKVLKDLFREQSMREE